MRIWEQLNISISFTECQWRDDISDFYVTCYFNFEFDMIFKYVWRKLSQFSLFWNKKNISSQASHYTALNRSQLLCFSCSPKNVVFRVFHVFKHMRLFQSYSTDIEPRFISVVVTSKSKERLSVCFRGSGRVTEASWAGTGSSAARAGAAAWCGPEQHNFRRHWHSSGSDQGSHRHHRWELSQTAKKISDRTRKVTEMPRPKRSVRLVLVTFA